MEVVEVRVQTKELQEGCILAADVNSLTNRPIIPSKTIMTRELLEVLQAFLIKEVVVEKTKVDGTAFIPSEVLEDEHSADRNDIVKKDEELSFSEVFLKSVQDYKKEFQLWQAGLPLDVTKVRAVILPLIEKMEGAVGELFSLHHYSTEKDYLYQHSIAVGLFSAFIGRKLNYQKGEVLQLALAGCLADCGMAKVPIQLVNKTGALTSAEFAEIKKHPTYSYRMVQNSPLIRDAAKIAIFQHHERLDGSGYPTGGKAGKIHPFAKIIAVADTFHAMTSARLYKKKQSPFRVLEMMIQDNFGKFDISAINALQSGIMNFSIGSSVKLSDGQIAEILFIEEKYPTRPLIKLSETDEIIHLEKNRGLFIEEVL